MPCPIVTCRRLECNRKLRDWVVGTLGKHQLNISRVLCTGLSWMFTSRFSSMLDDDGWLTTPDEVAKLWLDAAGGGLPALGAFWLGSWEDGVSILGTIGGRLLVEGLLEGGRCREEEEGGDVMFCFSTLTFLDGGPSKKFNGENKKWIAYSKFQWWMLKWKIHFLKD